MGETEYLLIILLFNIFLLAFVVAGITFVIQYKNKKRESQQLLAQQKIIHQNELIANELEIQSQTMQHIGREIHDNVGQQLTLASLYVQHLSLDAKSPEINNKVEQIAEIIDHSLSELRLLSKSLTDNRLNNGNLLDLLSQEIDKIKKLNQYEVQFEVALPKINFSYQIKNVIIRVCQEFFQNSIKYAACHKLGLILKIGENDTLILHFFDDGIGFNVNLEKSEGIGLSNMKRRVELIGGDYKLESHPGAGTKLTIVLPAGL